MKKILGCGCGAILFIGIAIFAVANYLGIHAEEPNPKPRERSTPVAASTPVKLSFPQTYLGKWQDKSGNTIVIRADGKADYHNAETDITGGILKIDETKKTLEIASVFGDLQKWEINRAPQTANDKTSIILNKMEFLREK